MFSCLQKKSKVTDEVWDLMDNNGDNIVNARELSIVAQFFHRAAIEDLENTLVILKATDPVQHVLGIAGRKNKLRLVDFKRLQYSIPTAVWKLQILPVLRRAEVDRLTR
jgi:hypothetical protein